MPENISNTHNNNKRSQPQQQVKKPKREKKTKSWKILLRSILKEHAYV